MNIRITFPVLLISLCFSHSVFAGLLANHPLAVNNTDGNPATGTSRMQDTGSGLTLDVQLDFAVFTASDFNTLFPSSGYTPTGSLVFTQQIILHDPSSTVGVNLFYQKGAGARVTDPEPGWFNTASVGGNQAPDSGAFSHSIVARWYFRDLSDEGQGDSTIDPGESSWGLAYSSNYVPALATTSTQIFGDEGLRVDNGIPNCIPSNVLYTIPEPTTCALALAAFCLVMNRRRSF
jgi:hypothetical protein